MQIKAVLLLSAASGALAGYYAEEPAYVTVDDKVYTSVKTCTDKAAKPTSEPVYEPAPTDYPTDYEVTYTSLEKVTVTSCGDYVTNCPAETYTSTTVSVSTCTGKASTDYYVPPANTTDYYVPPADYPTSVYETPVHETEYPTETHTVYTTVCPSEGYCYATTVTSTYCPGKPTDTYVPVPSYPAETTSAPSCPGGYGCPAPTTYAPPPVYTTSAPCPGGYDCPAPPKNETTYVPPPSYTGAASANVVSFGVAAVAGFAALFIVA